MILNTNKLELNIIPMMISLREAVTLNPKIKTSVRQNWKNYFKIFKKEKIPSTLMQVLKSITPFMESY